MNAGQRAGMVRGWALCRPSEGREEIGKVLYFQTGTKVRFRYMLLLNEGRWPESPTVMETYRAAKDMEALSDAEAERLIAEMFEGVRARAMRRIAEGRCAE